MNELVVAVSLWLSALYGLPEMEAPPRVRFLEPRQVAAVRYGRADIVHADEVVAVYEPLTRTIVLSDRWRADDVADLSVLVHELVHHLQRQVGAEHRCPEEGEALLPTRRKSAGSASSARRWKPPSESTPSHSRCGPSACGEWIVLGDDLLHGPTACLTRMSSLEAPPPEAAGRQNGPCYLSNILSLANSG